MIEKTNPVTGSFVESQEKALKANQTWNQILSPDHDG